jgi:hypothetical protein
VCTLHPPTLHPEFNVRQVNPAANHKHPIQLIMLLAYHCTTCIISFLALKLSFAVGEYAPDKVSSRLNILVSTVILQFLSVSGRSCALCSSRYVAVDKREEKLR